MPFVIEITFDGETREMELDKPELVVVVESMTSDDDMKSLFRDEVKPRLARFPEVGAYNQEI